MNSNEKSPSVIVFNTDAQMLDMMETILVQEGYAVRKVNLSLVSNPQALEDIILKDGSTTIFWGMDPPYRKKWKDFQQIKNSEPAEGKKFVLTAANVRELEKIVGRNANEIKILGLPFDIEEALNCIEECSGKKEGENLNKNLIIDTENKENLPQDPEIRREKEI